MMKRIVAGAAAAGLALTLMNAGSATAACPTVAQSTDRPAVAGPAGPSGTTVYGKQTSTTGGYIGVTGSTGWIEAGGGGSSAYVRGKSASTPVNGEIIVNGANSKVCVADKPVK